MKAVRVLVMAVVAAACGASVLAQGKPDTRLVERGRVLVEGIMACGNCHAVRDQSGQVLADQGLSGGMPFNEPMFRAHAANITPDRETGIGAWTDAQLAKAIREGVRPGGKPVIGPPMPIEFYRHIADRDLAAIVAYLRAQPAVRREVPASTFNFPLPPNWGPPVQRVSVPSRSDKVRYGAYLANIGHCMECHTPRDDKGMLQRQSLGAGGQVFNGPWGRSVSRNLTPHASGLKDWSDAEIARAVREGVRRDGQRLMPPMAFEYYRRIDDADMSALIAYLRSLKPVPLAAR